MIDYIQHHWIQIGGAIIGFIYLYFEYKASVWMWVTSILMAALYIYIFYDIKLYASMFIYIYFFCASIYGWYMWLRKNIDRDTGESIITHVPRNRILIVLLGIVAIWAVVYLLLTRYTENPFYITLGDALTTSLNIMALWMVSYKWAEQWLLLIPANIVSTLLFVAQGDIMSSILFAVFFIVSIFGYFKWKSMIVNNASNNSL